MIFQKTADQFVPRIFKGTIHGKDAVGDPCRTGEYLILKMQIQISARNVILGKRTSRMNECIF